MDIHIRIRGTDLTEAIRSHVARRLRFSLGRFASRLGRVTVRISEVNGPRGGVDKVCRISARLTHSGQVVVQETVDANLRVAIDHATERIGHSCGRELQRLRERGTGTRSMRTG